MGEILGWMESPAGDVLLPRLSMGKKRGRSVGARAGRGRPRPPLPVGGQPLSFSHMSSVSLVPLGSDHENRLTDRRGARQLDRRRRRRRGGGDDERKSAAAVATPDASYYTHSRTARYVRAAIECVKVARLSPVAANGESPRVRPSEGRPSGETGGRAVGQPGRPRATAAVSTERVAGCTDGAGGMASAPR